MQMNRGIMKDFRDKHLRPNLSDKDKLTAIVISPASKLGSEQLELLWTFRYYLSTDPKALPKVTPLLPHLSRFLFRDEIC